MMKRKIWKGLILSIIAIIIFNYISPIVVYAEPEIDGSGAAVDPDLTIDINNPLTPGSTGIASDKEGVTGAYGAQVAENAANGHNASISDTLSNMLDWGSGTLSYPLKMLIYAIGATIEYIMDGIAGTENEEVNVETILFNRVSLVNVNFFNKSNGNTFVSSLRESVSSWYVTMRNIAIVASLCVLLYIAIRMATSTIASDRAEYKRMLTDWLVSFILIFILQFIIILVVSLNESLVNILDPKLNSGVGTSNSVQAETSYIKAIKEQSKSVVSTFTEGFGAVIIYLILVCISFAFLIMYIKRLIVVAFLIIISPLITVTYAIDKVKDSKSQALDTWLKEFFWTILIQPFHCIIYLVFASIAFNSLSNAKLSSSVLAIMCMLFIMQAEDIIKKIFNIQADNVGKMSGAMALAAGGLLATAKVTGKTTAKVGGKVGKKIATVANKVPGGQAASGIVGGAIAATSSFVQKAGNKMESPMVKSAMSKFNDVINSATVKNTAQKVDKVFSSPKVRKVGRVLKKSAISYGKWTCKMAPRIVGLTAASVTAQGDLAKLILGYQAGGVVGDYVGEKIKNTGNAASNKYAEIKARRETKVATNNLKESYNQMRQQKGMSESRLDERTPIYLKMDQNGDIFKHLKSYEQEYVKHLQHMQSCLEKLGEDTSKENILSKIHTKDNENQEGNA